MIKELPRSVLNAISKQKMAWIKERFDYRLNKFELAASVLDMYNELAPENTPEVFFASGPVKANAIVKKLLGMTDAGVEDDSSVRFGRFKNARNMADRFFQWAANLAESSCANYTKSFDVVLNDELRQMVFWDLNFQFSRAVYERIDQSNRLKSYNSDYSLRRCLSPSWNDLDWTGFYKLIDCDLPSKNQSLHQFLESGGYELYAFSEFAVIIERPIIINRNHDLVLHADDEAAVVWADGTCLYFWNGIEVPAQLIESPLSITGNDIIAEENAEVRRCYQEKLGSERFGNLLGLISIDQKQDKFGHDLILYKTKDKDKLAGNHIYFAKVVCPSTGRTYFLCVPPSIKSVEEAVAWTFGKSPGDYNPVIET